MHRHGYKGSKFHRERDQRNALIKGLADSLVKYESIETTLPKAKAVVPYVEKLITKAKKGDLHNRRMVIQGLQTIESAHKLVDEIAPKLKGRDSGHLRIEKTAPRRGDNAQLARVSFVDDLQSAPVAKAAAKVETPATAEVVTPKPAAKKPAAKPKAAKETK
ncbi:MAG: ribosomal protein chloroplastic-like [Candidatus Saccharibacteria bacterium]|nr:ribosomal protein chloroplastic-like [Candidatus Saccharibacteria bacterium]